jgi:hypothetical protein
MSVSLPLAAIHVEANRKMLATRSIGVSSFGLPPDGACSPNLPIGGLASRSRSSCCQVRSASAGFCGVVSEDQQLCWFFLRPFHKAWRSSAGHVTGRARLFEEKPQRVPAQVQLGRNSDGLAAVPDEFSFYYFYLLSSSLETISPHLTSAQLLETFIYLVSRTVDAKKKILKNPASPHRTS